MNSLIAAMVAALSAASLVLLARSALGLCRTGATDPSDEARSAKLALYGCLIAVLTLGLFVRFM